MSYKGKGNSSQGTKAGAAKQKPSQEAPPPTADENDFSRKFLKHYVKVLSFREIRRHV
jgi:hypothetical protein